MISYEGVSDLLQSFDQELMKMKKVVILNKDRRGEDAVGSLGTCWSPDLQMMRTLPAPNRENDYRTPSLRVQSTLQEGILLQEVYGHEICRSILLGIVILRVVSTHKMDAIDQEPEVHRQFVQYHLP